MITPKDILHFWLVEAGEKAWYDGGHLDAKIAVRYEPLWQAARAGKLDAWMARPDSALALLIVIDQFPRNMFRGTARAFASDPQALSAAKQSIRMGHDLMTGLPERQFFYMPLMHSEILADQDQSVRMFHLNCRESGKLIHAQAHREQIRMFGRFPTRNEALGRVSTPDEIDFLQAGGYPALVRKLRGEVSPAM
jgi:uncharacterized protein (DUF924 family)